MTLTHSNQLEFNFFDEYKTAERAAAFSPLSKGIGNFASTSGEYLLKCGLLTEEQILTAPNKSDFCSNL
jgi:hypothetical protein